MKDSIDPMGGQAVIEGVLMRSKKKYAIAVRTPDDKILLKKGRVKSLTRYKLLNFPFIRGFINMIESMILGIKALTWSSNQQTGENEKLTTSQIFFTVLISFLFVVLLFIILPFYATKYLTSFEGFWFNLIDGIIRVLIFFIYLLSISRMKDIRKVFQYHGAEHKTVHAYEKELKLTYNNIKKYTTLHPRCGTSFLIIVLAISILVFSLVTTDSWTIKLLSRIILIPVIIGISYEVLKLSAKFQNNILMKLLIQPGLLVQKITTKEPTKKQIEVAVAALEAAK